MPRVRTCSCVRGPAVYPCTITVATHKLPGCYDLLTEFSPRHCVLMVQTDPTPPSIVDPVFTEGNFEVVTSDAVCFRLPSDLLVNTRWVRTEMVLTAALCGKTPTGCQA